MFHKLKTLKKHHQLIYTLIIAVGLISLWRGIWRLFDYYLFPTNFIESSIASIILGIAIIAITHHRLS